jgi:DNA-binding CsgD family transcriptional regulator
VLIGREREQEAIERLLTRARTGEAASLVLRGEPGVGKTALLRHALALAESMRVVRATGVEWEAELEYSGLLELCRPLLGELDMLPERQARALRVAFALAPGGAVDRFGVAAATLGLLAAAAERTPLLVAVDDAHWLDRASAEALLFAARRLLADRVALLFAARDEGFPARGLPELRVAGLDSGAAATLIEETLGRAVEPGVATAIHRSTGGNPLALVELPARLSDGQLTGAEPLAGPLPLTDELERAFAGRLEDLPEETRRALCVLAAAGSDALPGPLRALAALALDPRALGPAEDAGLLAVDGRAFAFRHPLLRSVAYYGRPVAERRAAHAALAEALDASGEADRRAWQLAAAAVGHDDRAGDALAETAAAALARGGHAAASAALERAARLTADRALRLRRLAEAAQAAWDAGAHARAGALLDEALAGGPDPALRARLLGLSGRIEFQAGSLSRARDLLLDAAATLAAQGQAAQAVTLLGVAALTLHNLARVDEAIDVARRSVDLAAGEPADVRLRAEYHLGRALQTAGRTAEAQPLLERVVAHLLAPAEPSRFALQRASIALALLDRATEAATLARRALAAAQGVGPMQVAYALLAVAQLALRSGEWREAHALAEDGLALGRDLDQENLATTFAAILVRMAAARGDEEACRRREAVTRPAIAASGNVVESLQLDHALAVLDLGHDRLEEAAGALAGCAGRAEELRILDRDLSPEPDLVEALVRLGRPDEAQAWLHRWLARGAAGAGRWGPALVARCRGLLASDDAVAEEFTQALRLHGPLADPYAEARTRLVYGERLRRLGRRVDARRELQAALDGFERLDAGAWGELARRELRASGAKLRRGADAGNELTPQELQVALQVAEGKANKEVAAALFLSPKTVEFHLGRVFRKVGVASRAELVRRFAAEPAAGTG